VAAGGLAVAGAPGAEGGFWAPARGAAATITHAAHVWTRVPVRFMARTLHVSGWQMLAHLQAPRELRRTMATVRREVQINLPASLTMSMVQTWERPPMCTGRAVPVTSPVRADRT